MSNLGFGPLAQRPLADVPSSGITGGIFSSFGQPTRRKLSIAIIAATGVIAAPFVPPATTPAFASFSQPLQKKLKAYDQPTQSPFVASQSYIFSQFDQPRKSKQHYIEDSSAWLEQEPPTPIIWGWNSNFSQPAKKYNLAYQVNWNFSPFVAPVIDVFGPDVWRKKKRKKKPYDLVDLQIKEREDRLKDIELAVYGPTIEYKFTVPHQLIPTPVNPGNLPQIMLAVQQQKIAQAKAREDAEDEAEIEDILKEL